MVFLWCHRQASKITEAVLVHILDGDTSLCVRAAAIFDTELRILNFIPFKILDKWWFAM